MVTDTAGSLLPLLEIFMIEYSCFLERIVISPFSYLMDLSNLLDLSKLFNQS